MGTRNGRDVGNGRIKRRNRNFDPEMRIVARRMQSPTKQRRGRSRSPVFKSIGGTSSIKGSKPSAGNSSSALRLEISSPSRGRSHTLSPHSGTSADQNIDAISPGNSRKVVRFSLSPTRSSDESTCDDDKSWEQPLQQDPSHLTKEPAALAKKQKMKLTANTGISTRVHDEKVLAAARTETSRNHNKSKVRFGVPVSPTDDTISLPEESGDCFSPVSVTQQIFKKGPANYMSDKILSILRCGDFAEKEKDSHAVINNAMDLIHAASADPEEIRSYIKKNRRNKKVASILSKISNVESMVNNLSASSVSGVNVDNGRKPRLSASQRLRIQALKKQGDIHAHFHRYEEAIKCYVTLVQMFLSEGISISETTSDDYQAMLQAVQKLREYHHKYVTLANSEDIFRMGREHEAEGRFIRAANCYTVAFRIRRDVLGTTKHPSFLLLLNAIGSLQTKRGLVQDASSFLYLAQDIQNETNAGPIIRAITERNIGASQEVAGNYDGALHHYNESFRLHRQSRGVTWNADIGMINNEWNSSKSRASTDLNELLMEPVHCQVKLRESPTAHEEGLEVAFESSINLYSVSLSEKVVAQDDIQKEIDVDVDLAMTLHCIGRLLTQHFENHLFATNAYINSLYLTKKSLGPDHPNVAALLGSIGNICLEREAYERACTFYREGLQIEEKFYGESHPEVAVTTFNIGAVEFAQGNYIHALHAFQRTIKIQKAAFGADSALIGLAFHCVGEVAERMKLFPKALKAYQAALEIDEITFGKSHPEVGHTLHKMGKIQYLHLKNYEEAKRLFLAAFDIYMLNEFCGRDTRTLELLRDLGNTNAYAQLNS